MTMLNLGGGASTRATVLRHGTGGRQQLDRPPGTAWTQYPLLGELTTAAHPGNGQGAWIRVEYLNNAGPHGIGITRDWLGYGFTRQYNLPCPTAAYRHSRRRSLRPERNPHPAADGSAARSLRRHRHVRRLLSH